MTEKAQNIQEMRDWLDKVKVTAHNAEDQAELDAFIRDVLNDITDEDLQAELNNNQKEHLTDEY